MENSYFFDGEGLEYTSDSWANYFKQFLSTGVYHQDYVPTLDVTASGTDMTVTLGEGSAIINGRMYENTDDLVLTHDSADATLDRIDRVVIQLDKAQREITAVVKTGTPSSSPEPPELLRTEFTYEISLCQVLIEAGKSLIEQSQITDERQEKVVCGLVQSLISPIKDPVWLDLTLQNGVQEYSVGSRPRYAKVGSNVFIRGAVTNLTTDRNLVIGNLPTGFRPIGSSHSFAAPTSTRTVGTGFARWVINTNGDIVMERTSDDDVNSSHWFPISTNYLVGG